MNAKRTTWQIAKDLLGRTIYNVSHVKNTPTICGPGILRNRHGSSVSRPRIQRPWRPTRGLDLPQQRF